MTAQSAERCLFADDPSVDGHFPGNPIIPGAALLREVISVLSADGRSICCYIVSAKFLHPVRPGERLTILWEERSAGAISFTCSTGTPERRVLVGMLRMRPR